MRKLLLVASLLAFIGALSWPGKRSISQTADVTLVGACDIADGFAFNLSGAFATAALLDSFPSATVFACGDLAYDNSTDSDFGPGPSRHPVTTSTPL